MHHIKKTLLFILLVLITVTLDFEFSLIANGQSQPPDDNRGIDMMLVIDNSCSMFSDEVARQSGKCVTGGGNDTGLLRIIGAEIFFRSLGLGDPVLEEQHQIGVISFGGDSNLIHPLSSIREARDILTSKVQNPDPQPWTDTEQALQGAYAELERAGRPNNTPAIVLITDGKPEITVNQPYDMSAITSLLNQHQDIPIFVMLVQNNDDLSGDYDEFITFWQQADIQNSHIFHYVIEEQRQIEDAYEHILTQIADEIPGLTEILQPNEPLRFFVDEFVQALRITVIHNDPTNRGNITITNPNGNVVQPVAGNDVRFSSGDAVGRVDVIYIGEGYLTPDLREKYWTIESDALVRIRRIPRGAYQINFTEPTVSFTQISNVYNAVSPHPIGQALTIRFNLIRRDDGSTVPSARPQLIYGSIIDPDGNETNLPIPANMLPDENGYYELPPYQFPNMSEDEFSTYQIVLNAGEAEPQATQRVPIAKAILLVQVGQFPSIGEISPTEMGCYPGQPANVSVVIDNFEFADPRTVQVRVFAAGEDIALESDSASPTVYRGDVANLCAPLVANLACSTSDGVVMTVRLSAQTLSGAPAPMQQKDIQVQTLAPTCTPTPTAIPTATPTPTPTPTPPPPPPDRDGDGGPDAVDLCATIPGIPGLKFCPIWMLIPVILITIGVVVALWKWIIPWLWVRTPWGKPPTGHIRICNKSDKGGARDIGIYSRGMQKRTNKITIGGDRKKSHIYVKGLETPFEFVIEKDGQDVVIRKGKTKTKFSDRGDAVATSQTDVTIFVATDPRKLRNC